MEDYLTVDELSSKIKFSKQSLYNLIYKKTFIMGKHYFKPTPKKILFKWSEIKAWVERASDCNDEAITNEPAPKDPDVQNQPAQSRPKSSINI